MNIMIVSPGSSWILDSIAKKTCASCPEHFTAWSKPTMQGISYSPPEGPWDGILFWDIQNMWHPEWKKFYPNSLHVGAYTHAHENNPQNINSNIRDLDGVIHMASRYRDMFEANDLFPPERMTVLRPGEVSHFPLKKTKIGICQRGEHVGKGKDFLPEVIRSLRQEIKNGMELHFKGKGWDDAFEGKTFRGAVFVGAEKPETWLSGSYYGVSAFSYASEDAKSYPPFFEKLDYYMIVSLYEGGPMGMLEALATGLPIISSEVGWVPEFKRVAHLYPAADVDALAIILTEIAERRLLRRAEVEGMSYKNYAAGVLQFFEKIRGMK